MDDPLSAVDSGVAQHLMKYCFLGILKQKARILITHHTHLLEGFENEVQFYSLEGARLIPSSIEFKRSSLSEQVAEEKKSDDSVDDAIIESLDAQKTEVDGKLVELEKRETGHVDSKVILDYASNVGFVTFTLVILSLIFMQASRNFNDYWIAVWVSDISNSSRATLDLKILAIIAAANSAFTLLRSFIFAFGGIIAAKRTFSRLLDSVLGAPVTFFEVNPLGRVLNRFAADTFSIDDQFPFMANILCAQTVQLIGTCAVILFTEWYVFILLVPLFLSYLKIQKVYRICSRELKRLDTVTSSPIYSKFSETVDGVGFLLHSFSLLTIFCR
jgi:ATP-binding cassette subfamily C (CFTR/MRP) protein 10